MSLNTYLFFDGNCREAFEHYRAVFGGDFLMLRTYADAPAGTDVPEAEKGRIMHVSLPVGSAVLMGEDSCSAFGPPPAAGENFAISVSAGSRERSDELFARLSEEGAVKMPMQDMFWGAYFGTCRDRFGINWMISHEPAE